MAKSARQEFEEMAQYGAMNQGLGDASADAGERDSDAYPTDADITSATSVPSRSEEDDSPLDLRALDPRAKTLANIVTQARQMSAEDHQAPASDKTPYVPSNRVASPQAGMGVKQGLLQGLVDAMHAYGRVAMSPQERLKRDLLQEQINSRENIAKMNIEDRKQRAVDQAAMRKQLADMQENWTFSLDGKYKMNKKTGEILPVGVEGGVGKPQKAKPWDLKYSPATGLPTHAISPEGTAYPVESSEIPAEGKALVDQAMKNHQTHLDEEEARQKRQFAYQQSLQDARINQQRRQTALKVYGTALDSESRYKVMLDALGKGNRGDQQADVNLIANHLGMTSGLQKNMRINQTMWNEAMGSAPTLERILAKFTRVDPANGDRIWTGPLSGAFLTPEQRRQMVDLASVRYKVDVSNARQRAQVADVIDLEPGSFKQADKIPISLPKDMGGSEAQQQQGQPQTGNPLQNMYKKYGIKAPGAAQ